MGAPGPHHKNLIHLGTLQRVPTRRQQACGVLLENFTALWLPQLLLRKARCACLVTQNNLGNAKVWGMNQSKELNGDLSYTSIALGLLIYI